MVSASARGASAASRVATARASAASDVRGHDPGDQPEPLGVRGRQRLAEQRQLGRLAPDPTSRGRNHVAPLSGTRPIRPNASTKRALGRQPDVAGERERRPGPGRDAVDRADDRLVEGAHRADDRVVALAELDGERRGVGLEPLLEVLAGAEGPAGAGQHDRPDGSGRGRSPGTPPGAPA